MCQYKKVTNIVTRISVGIPCHAVLSNRGLHTGNVAFAVGNSPARNHYQCRRVVQGAGAAARPVSTPMQCASPCTSGTRRPLTQPLGVRSCTRQDRPRGLRLSQKGHHRPATPIRPVSCCCREVLDLGEDEALIPARGCKPIQAVKTCWHGKPALRYRRRPPPKIASVPLVSPLGVDDASSSPPKEPIDLDTLYARPLSDFCLDLSDVAIPSGEFPQAEAETTADELFSVMTR